MGVLRRRTSDGDVVEYLYGEDDECVEEGFQQEERTGEQCSDGRRSGKAGKLKRQGSKNSRAGGSGSVAGRRTSVRRSVPAPGSTT